MTTAKVIHWYITYKICFNFYVRRQCLSLKSFFLFVNNIIILIQEKYDEQMPNFNIKENQIFLCYIFSV